MREQVLIKNQWMELIAVLDDKVVTAETPFKSLERRIVKTYPKTAIQGFRTVIQDSVEQIKVAWRP